METATMLSEYVVALVELVLGVALLWMVGVVVLWALSWALRAKR